MISKPSSSASAASKNEALVNKTELLAILEELEGTDVEYKIRMAIHRLRALVDKLNG